MTAPANLIQLLGTWSGASHLWLDPDSDARESTSTVTLSTIAKGRFVRFAYTWAFEGEAQDGLLLLSRHTQDQSLHAVWIDSWHMGEQFMICQGTADEKGLFSLQGSYAAPPGPDWGWRIVIDAGSADALKMQMYNITPEGEEMLAVETDYRRQEA